MRRLALVASVALAAGACGAARAQAAALAGNLQICQAASPSSAFDVSQSAADGNGDYWVAYSCKTNCADWRQCRMPANAGGGGSKQGLAFVVDGMGGHFSFTTEQTGAKTVLLHTGTGGTNFMHSLSRQIENASDAKVVMVRWEGGFSNWGWFTRTSAPATRVPAVTRRIASVIAWAHENLAGASDFGTVGCSMGTQATLGAVYWHGVDSLVDYQLMVGGPGLWDINSGCGRRRHTSGYCDLDARRACGAHADCGDLSSRSRCVIPGPIPLASLYESVVNHVHATRACDVSAADSTTPIHAPFDESGFGFTAGDWDFDHPIDFQMDLWGGDGDRRWAMGDAMRVFNSITSAAGHPKRWNTTTDSNHCAAIGNGTALRLLVEGMGLGQSDDDDDDDGSTDIANPAQIDTGRWDPGLRAAVERALDKAAGAALTEADLLSLRELDAGSMGVESLAGLGAAANLERLWLDGNRLADVSALSGLAALAWLNLSDNELADATPLARLTGLTVLLLDGNRLTDLAPLAELRGLTGLSLAGNAVADIAPLAGLAALDDLTLTDNLVADLAPLAGLARLERLRLGGNRVADLGPLADLATLRRLWLGGNQVVDVAPLAELVSLRWLDVSDNRVVDIAPLAGLEALERLRLGGNRVSALRPLALGPALGEGDVVGLRGNPLSAASLGRHVPALRARGVAVLAGVPLPYFPSSSGAGREGFVRVANHSAESGEVLVWAVDAAGTRRGPARLALGAGRTAHFNTRDLEAGNAAKGLWPGVGAPGAAGAWRLELTTTLDVEAACYVRTADGFVTSASGALARSGRSEALLAEVFNPGWNRAQRSVLRLWNPGAALASASVWGVDDAGSGRLATGLSLAPGAALEVGAAALEAGGLGTGQGKWRLSVNAAWPVEAMSLLRSAGARVSNLSSRPAADADGVWRVPLFPAARKASGAGWRQGFARVANLSSRAGSVLVTAVDDSGRRAGPVALTLGALRTVHFNSVDLEAGNAAKGLAAGVGAPSRGDWRLEVRPADGLKVSVSSYARSAEGFLTGMDATAPHGADGTARVFFFNPGSNHDQRSLLRLINDGAEPAEVVVGGVDDAGAIGGAVRLMLAAGAARTLTAAALEVGGEGMEGTLGDGVGKWRLTVESDAPVTVMSLLESKTGHLANLSAGGGR